MSEATCQREACSCCGSVEWREAVFANGVITCASCAAEIRAAREKARPAASMMPTEGQLLLEQWIAPLNRGDRA
ncbi:MAG: hypothetical protein WCG85_18255 [Polyangia bacterium]